ncbi:metallophosphoesterase [Actinokineospora sp. HUAS TT18]|uniref:metallophosphoesterase n=1 Tax=Actinokineospora sp. HUAS TT18 TaxID=3447451 RepID=UPI003F522D3F
MIVLAHLSDPHFDLGPRARDRAAAVMAYVNGLTGLTAVVVTGDIADHGTPAEYREAADVLRGPHPMLFTTGNHDSRDPFTALAPLNQVHRFPGCAVVTCDSSIPGADPGRLDELAWLDSALAELDEPTFVAFHHPPAPLGHPYIDGIGLGEPDALAAVLAKHPHVVAVLCGHAHTGAATTFAGRPLLVAPGIVSTVRMPFEPGDVVNLDAPPAIALHVLDGGRLVTHFRAV